MIGLHERARTRNHNSRLGLQSIGEMQLGPTRTLRASFDQVEGRTTLHLRRWRYSAESRAMQPTDAALLLNVAQLPQFYDLIGRALAQARKDGLVFVRRPA